MWQYALWDSLEVLFLFFWFSDFSIFNGTFSNFLTLENRAIFFQNATPPTILYRSNPIYFCNSLGWSLTKLVAQNFEFWLYLIFKKLWNFHLHWSIWGWKFENATSSTVLIGSIPMFFCNNLRWFLTKLAAQNFEFGFCSHLKN